MAEKKSAAKKDATPFVPQGGALDDLREAAKGCTACDLHLTGTQTVFGQGPSEATTMLVGEQPGDMEDKLGAPFVGPAGQLLDRALAEAGMDRSTVYVTNAVKHFKWEARGKRRIHSKPNVGEIRACFPWLKAEIERVKPTAIVVLGATAGQALLGKDFRITQSRGLVLQSNWARYVVPTLHPSAILRMPEAEQRDAAYAQIVEDLRTAAALVS